MQMREVVLILNQNNLENTVWGPKEYSENIS